jgi:hypothetical protein
MRSQNMDFEKRLFERNPLGIHGDVILDSVKYPGYVENACGDGMHVVASTGNVSAPFIPETNIDVKFHCPAKKPLSLKCEIRWVHINKTPRLGLSYRMGVNIIDGLQACSSALKYP